MTEDVIAQILSRLDKLEASANSIKESLIVMQRAQLRTLGAASLFAGALIFILSKAVGL